MHPGDYQKRRDASLEGLSIPPRWRVWLRVGPAAAYLGIGVGTLNKLRLSGAGPPYAKLGHVVVYDTDDLDAWTLFAGHHTSCSLYDKAIGAWMD